LELSEIIAGWSQLPAVLQAAIMVIIRASARTPRLLKQIGVLTHEENADVRPYRLRKAKRRANNAVSRVISNMPPSLI
jgi:hypothetical protein